MECLCVLSFGESVKEVLAPAFSDCDVFAALLSVCTFRFVLMSNASCTKLRMRRPAVQACAYGIYL